MKFDATALDRLLLAFSLTSDLWMKHVMGPNFLGNVVQSALSFGPPGSQNFGPFNISMPVFAYKLTRALTSVLTTCAVVGIAATSKKYPLLNKAAHRWEYYPVLQQFYFSRLWIPRGLLWIIRNTLPTILYNPMTVFSDHTVRLEDGEIEQFRTPVVSAASTCEGGPAAFAEMSDGEFAKLDISVAADEQSTLKLHTDALQTAGVFRTVLETQLVEYISALIFEQSQWISSYMKAPKTRRRGIARFHVVATATTFFEFSASFLTRVVGAKVGSYIWKKNGYGAFWGEVLLHGVGSRFIYFAANHFGAMILQKLDKAFPQSQAEVEYEEAQEQEHRERHQEAHERHQEVVETKEDYYGVLGVSSTSSPDDIKKAFRKLALKHHPDKIHSLPQQEREVAAAKFKQINQANTILSDPSKRQQYDQVRLFSPDAKGEPPAFLVKLSQLPIVLKLLITIAVVVGGSEVFLGTLYSQMFFFVKIASSPGPGLLRHFRD